jgi:hypothetical protein
MLIQFNEQDVVDSVCVYTASHENCDPYDVDVDLSFESSRFTAQVNYPRGNRVLDDQDLIDAIAIFLRDYHNFEPTTLRIDLTFQEGDGVGATIEVAK